MKDYEDLFSTGDIGLFLFTINPLGDKSYFSDVRIPIHAAEGYVFKAPQRAGLGRFPAGKATGEERVSKNKNGCVSRWMVWLSLLRGGERPKDNLPNKG